jgi:hypothetical protein
MGPARLLPAKLPFRLDLRRLGYDRCFRDRFSLRRGSCDTSRFFIIARRWVSEASAIPEIDASTTANPTKCRQPMDISERNIVMRCDEHFP